MRIEITPARFVTAEGARIAFVTCKTCGAALLVDADDDFVVSQIHGAWHDRIEANDPEATQ